MAINSKNLYKSYSSESEDLDFETLPEASVNGALQSLYILYHDLFYGKVSLGCISQISGEHL